MVGAALSERTSPAMGMIGDVLLFRWVSPNDMSISFETYITQFVSYVWEVMMVVMIL